MTRRNPWNQLPNSSPFVLPDDLPFVEAFNRSAKSNVHIHTELLPEPFCGPFDAPVVVLLLNPGFSKEDTAFHAQSEFRLRLLAAIQAESKFPPHFHLNHDADWPGGKWWSRSVKPLIQDVGQDCVANNLLSIEYFPYHSLKFQHGHLRLPSQDFSFSLVHSAINRKAEIICVRGANLWFGAIPQLESYKQLSQVQNPRSASLSTKNLSSYSSVVGALRRVATPSHTVNRALCKNAA